MMRVIDLFAGIGGMRRGFENACKKFGIESECVFTSEIKTHAVKILEQNYPGENICGDITMIMLMRFLTLIFFLRVFRARLSARREKDGASMTAEGLCSLRF